MNFCLLSLFLLYKASPNFTISFQPQDIKVAQEIIEFAEIELLRISKDMEVEQGFISHINIRLVFSTSEVEEINVFPDWGIGCAIPDKYMILLKSPRIIKYPIDIRTLVAHEISHIILGNISPVKIPRWFDEGMAMYESSEWKLGESIWLSWANFTHSILPLSSIETYFPENHRKAKLAYVESFSTISFIVNQFGEESLKEIIRTLRGNNNSSDSLIQETPLSSFSQVLQNVLGLNSDDFTKEWEKWVKRQYTGFSLLINTLFPGILLLLVFFLVICLKRRKIKADNIKICESKINTNEHD